MICMFCTAKAGLWMVYCGNLLVPPLYFVGIVVGYGSGDHTYTIFISGSC